MRRLCRAAALLIPLVWLLPATSRSAVYQSFAPYDEGELPGSALPSTWFSAYGVFFFPTLDVSPIFTIERFRFWHREQNATPDPYRIHLVVRSTASQTIYVIDTIEDLMTTCSNCWEEVEIERSFWDSSTPGWSYGIFIQPLGGGAVTAEPGLRVDFSVAEPLVNLWAYYDDLYGFSNLIYMEEYDGGDFFMEVIVRYDVTTATVATSLSAIKALY